MQILRYLGMLGGGSEQQLVRPAITRVNDWYSTACRCHRFLDIAISVSHPIMSVKCLSVSPASGEKKKRKAMT